jgi:GNAT superfamily N-acetyltransferase
VTQGEGLSGPVPIQGSHQVDLFDCGNGDLNRFLQKHALQSDRSHMAKTFVALRGLRVVGFYSLCAACVEYEVVPERLQKGVPHHPMPFTLLARLGVDLDERGRGLGSALLKDSFKRFLQACELIASRGLVTHAKDEGARSFYFKYGFVEWPLDSYHLYLPTKDIRKTIEGR